MPDRFFCPDSPVDGRLLLIGDEARHLIKVRRVAVGEVVELFDGRGTACRAEVRELGRDRAELTFVERIEPRETSPCSLTLATAVPKGERFDWLVEKATELGVARLVPLMTERSTVDPRSAKLDRLRRTVVEASKQSRRDLLMELAPGATFDALIRARRDDLRLIAHPGGVGIALALREGSRRSTTLAIGPERGFTEDEVDRARSEGWVVVGLGSTVLRIETAAIAGCSTILVLADVASIEKEVS